MSNSGVADHHEAAFIRAFITPERRDRYLTLLANPKKRSEILDRLNHQFLTDLDPRWITKQPNQDVVSRSEHCCLLADETKWDRRLVPTADVPNVLAEAVFGIVVSYIPGRLAVYKDEAPADLVWIERREAEF